MTTMFLLKKDATYNILHSEATSGLKKMMRVKFMVVAPADQDSSGQQCSTGHTFGITC